MGNSNSIKGLVKQWNSKIIDPEMCWHVPQESKLLLFVLDYLAMLDFEREVDKRSRYAAFDEEMMKIYDGVLPAGSPYIENLFTNCVLHHFLD